MMKRNGSFWLMPRHYFFPSIGPSRSALS